MRSLDSPRRARTDAGAAFAASAPAGGQRGAVLGLLAFTWFAHAALVVSSALGAQPLVGRARATAILAVAAVFAAVLALRATRRRAPVVAAVPTSGPDMPRAARLCANVLWFSGLSAVALGLTAAFVLPIVAYDALGYRLPVIAQWLDAGRIAWVASDDPVRNGYPLGQEAVSALLVAATSAMRCASATSFVFVVAGALSIGWLAQASGVRDSLSRMSAALFLLVPITILNAPSGYVDAAFAGAVIALVCTATLLWSQPDPWHAVAAGMAAANVLALKGTGVAFVAVVAACVALASSLRALRARRAVWIAGLRFSLIASACAAPGAFWVFRNIAHTGNPLWPIQVEVAGHTLFRGVARMDAILSAASNTPIELAKLSEAARVAFVWLQPHGPAVDFDDRLAGLGWAFPILALPALVACLVSWVRDRAARGNSALALVALMMAGCFVLQPLRWWPRYSLWLWGAGALAIALQAEALARAGRSRLLAAGLALLTMLSVAEGAFALVHAKGAHTALARWLGRESDTSGADLGPRHALNASSWVAPRFWELGIERAGDVCRGAWKPASDNANLDGVWAQLEPRPRVHILPDDDGNWPRVRRAWREAGCARLLLLHGSPVLSSANLDPEVSVAPVVAFDPLFVVGPRSGAP